MSFEQPIETDDNWFIAEDRTLRLVVYTEGTTLADITLDPAANREDIDGWSIDWELRKSQHGAVSILVKTAAITDGENGEAEVVIASADTAALPPGDYFHTFARVDVGEQGVLAFGEAVLRRSAVV
jgi:hypothetical protein